MPDSPAEKRAQARLRISIDATFDDALRAESVRCTVADLSSEGLGANTEEFFPVGTVYAFNMKREPALSLRGEVRWIRSQAREGYRFGVRFVDLTSADVVALTEFLRSKRKPPSV